MFISLTVFYPKRKDSSGYLLILTRLDALPVSLSVDKNPRPGFSHHWSRCESRTSKDLNLVKWAQSCPGKQQSRGRRSPRVLIPS